MEPDWFVFILAVGLLASVGLVAGAFAVRAYRRRRHREGLARRTDDVVRGELEGDDIREHGADHERPDQPPRDEEAEPERPLRPGPDNLRRFR